jgi:hypothetical protein
MLLAFFQLKGIDVELEKEFLYNTLSHSDDPQAIEEKIITLIYPDRESQTERLKKRAAQIFKKGENVVTRVKADLNSVIKSENPLTELRNRKM